jgi:hypothetical protein
MPTPMLDRLRARGVRERVGIIRRPGLSLFDRLREKAKCVSHAATRIVAARIGGQFLWDEVEPSSARHRYADLARPDPLRLKEIPGRVGITMLLWLVKRSCDCLIASFLSVVWRGFGLAAGFRTRQG